MTKRYNILTRCLAAVALLFVYVASTSAILVGATTSPAQAYRGRGGWGYRGGGWGYRGRGYGYRGYGYRGGYGYGYGVVGPRCWWTPRGVRVCRW
ncbi:hypothetical protein CI1B_59220 [Bradyrhizobium ivorense]|uniref:Uncharacterized protein n=1 Tax=Bradyrhizobium ivorense TaxID=2511166 RepID=A0A508TMG8_9BRAD|nr:MULTISPECIES: hypothetical protein [Bradyrhizobium]VIO73942.1 hypothetical protein CI41S_40530 [Bradyrhizobium ivorense]VIO75416.1 hypothetical protein CI1B_59220 [Bradyrhizobium ivorense]